MTEENKALVRNVYREMMSENNSAAIDKYVSARIVDHDPSPGQEPGLDGVRQFFDQMNTAFPDMSVAIDLMVSEGIS